MFGKLSYSDKAIAPIGRPVDDLRALYKKKDEDYNYVLDNMNTAETAINNLPFPFSFWTSI